MLMSHNSAAFIEGADAFFVSYILLSMNIELVKEYLKGRTIDSVKEFMDVLNVCGNLLDCWDLNGVSGHMVRRFQTKASRLNAYKEFCIPKKSGGVRRISTPVKELKNIQRALNLLLQAVAEISPSAMGFIPSRSVKDNAAIHTGQKVVFNCDLKNFFPSVTKTMVRSALRNHPGHRISSNEVINLICSLSTVPDEDGVEVLPQGAPTSPILSNIALYDLDRRLEGFARANGYRYSRYADDITFSHSHEEMTMRQDKIDALFSIISEYGLTVNPKKTKTYTMTERMEVTGLTVGGKVNVSRGYAKQLRTLLHLWESRGLDAAQQIYSTDFCSGSESKLTSVINGKINYLAMIKGNNDSTYRKLKYRYRKLMQEIKSQNRNA